MKLKPQSTAADRSLTSPIFWFGLEKEKLLWKCFIMRSCYLQCYKANFAGSKYWTEILNRSWFWNYFFIKSSPKCVWLKDITNVFIPCLTKKLWFFCCKKWILTNCKFSWLQITLGLMLLRYSVALILPYNMPHKA